jgi:predicted  nucleic acid-binding Zn-ribbon protein
MAQPYGLTEEMYRAIIAVVDDRTQSIRVLRQDFDRLIAAQARIEEALDRLTEAHIRSEERFELRFERIEVVLAQLAEAQARTEAEFQKYREQSEERFARIEAALNRLAEAQARTEAQVRELAEAQARLEERVSRLEAIVAELVEAQRRTDEAIKALAEAQARTEAQLQDLIQVVKGMQDTLAAVKGRQLEFNYHYRAGAYFGPLLRRVRALLPVELESELETRLTMEDFRDLLALDLVVTGHPRHLPDAPQVWLAVEISSVVDRRDVERAIRRAELLRRAGLRAIPAVAGEDITVGAQRDAEAHRVLVLQDGQALFWEAALADVLD